MGRSGGSSHRLFTYSFTHCLLSLIWTGHPSPEGKGWYQSYSVELTRSWKSQKTNQVKKKMMSTMNKVHKVIENRCREQERSDLGWPQKSSLEDTEHIFIDHLLYARAYRDEARMKTA